MRRPLLDHTLPNLPPWGANSPRHRQQSAGDSRTRAPGDTSCWTLAMSQFSYGALASYRARRRAAAGRPVDSTSTTADRAIRRPSKRPSRAAADRELEGSGLSMLLT